MCFKTPHRPLPTRRRNSPEYRSKEERKIGVYKVVQNLSVPKAKIILSLFTYSVCDEKVKTKLIANSRINFVANLNAKFYKTL